MIVKICETHGKLTPNQVRTYTRKDKPYVFKLCILCEREKSRKKYVKNPDKKLKKDKAWRAKNKDAVQAINARCKEKYRQKYNEQSREYYVKERELLSDNYIKILLYGTTKYKDFEVPQDLIEMKRDLLKLKRVSILMKRKIKELE